MKKKTRSRTQIILGAITLVGALGIAPIFPNQGLIQTAEASLIDTSKKPLLDLNGHYTYLTHGRAVVSQNGNQVEMFLTWSPASTPGPHYQVRATLKGIRLVGTWRPIGENKWYGFSAVSPGSGDRIYFKDSEDPINANFNKVILLRK